MALLLGWNISAHAAVNGTLQERLLTFSDTATNTVTFTVATGLGAGEAASILLDFTTDGSSTPPVAEPFSTPASVTFAFTYAGSPLAALNFTAAQAAAGGGFTASSGVATPNVTLSAAKPGSTFGRYVLTLTFPAGGTGLSSNWTLVIGGLPTSPVTRATVYIDGGKFKTLASAGPCAGGASPTCPPGQTCKGPCPICPPVSICKVKPWLCEVIVWVPNWFPWPHGGPPCLSCPGPWVENFGEEFERVVVAFTPLAKGGEPLGEGQVRQIKLNIAGGRPIGDVVDLGGGQYAQMIESRKGEPSPRVSANIAGQTTPDFVAGSVTAGSTSPLTLILSILLVLAVAGLAYLSRKNRAATNVG